MGLLNFLDCTVSNLHAEKMAHALCQLLLKPRRETKEGLAKKMELIQRYAATSAEYMKKGHLNFYHRARYINTFIRMLESSGLDQGTLDETRAAILSWLSRPDR